MKTISIISIVLFSFAYQSSKTFHDFQATTITGEEISLSNFKGKKILVVNVASKCGLTPQYKELQELYDTYSDKNFVILGFPANNFLSQEPGTDEEIAQFCEVNYGVTFPIMSKISVKGDDIHPIYDWLTDEEQNGVWSGNISWNFQKFLIDEEGKFVKTLGPRTSPLDKEITDWIEGK
jgi:glutathione peroxidase